MRFYAFGPRLFGLRTGISVGPEDFRRRSNGRTMTRGNDIDPNQGQFLYVMKGDHGMFKVGISGNPVARLATLRTASPFPLEMVFVCVVPGSAQVQVLESRVHEMLARHRCNGEWFDCPYSHVIAAIYGSATEFGIPMSAPPYGTTPEQFVNGIYKTLAQRGGIDPNAQAHKAGCLGAMWSVAKIMLMTLGAIMVAMVIWLSVHPAHASETDKRTSVEKAFCAGIELSRITAQTNASLMMLDGAVVTKLLGPDGESFGSFKCGPDDFQFAPTN